jgi:Fe-S-cluster containining protein
MPRAQGDKLGLPTPVAPLAMNPPPEHPNASPVTCATCAARCCRLEVMLMPEDDVPEALTAIDAWGGTVMARLDDGLCAALDRRTMLCTIYERRPTICRDFEMGGYDCVVERAAPVPIIWHQRETQR